MWSSHRARADYVSIDIDREVLLSSRGVVSMATRTDPALNVLYILVDDLRSDFGFTHAPLQSAHHTPHFDALAEQSTFFAQAYAQVTFCVPSRSSFLTGLRPEYTGSVHNDQLRTPVRVARDAPLIPGRTVLDHFKRAGYTVASVGKIFHFGEQHPALQLPVVPATLDLLGRPCDSTSATDVREPQEEGLFGFPKACKLPFGSFVDERVAASAVKYLRMLSEKTRTHRHVEQAENATEGLPLNPFLLAVGFSRPHNPYHFPSKHLDALPLANQTDIATVSNRHDSQPSIAFADPSVCNSHGCARELRRFYRGAVSHLDEMLGIVLRALVRLRLANTTLVALHSDHAMSLGENGAWQKRLVFDHTSRVPLFISDPLRPASRGVRITDSVVELVDVLPTLLDLSRANRRMPPPLLQGRSLRSLLEPSNLTALADSHAGPRTDSFRYAFTLAPRLLYLSRRPGKSGPARNRSTRAQGLLVDGGAPASSFASMQEMVDASRRTAINCSAELARGPFGPGRSCRFVAMGFSVRSKAWRYTRWERWPLPSRPHRVWTVGEGTLLAEELYEYKTSMEASLTGASGAPEEVNLLWSQGSSVRTNRVRKMKDELMAALLRPYNQHHRGQESAAHDS